MQRLISCAAHSLPARPMAKAAAENGLAKRREHSDRVDRLMQSGAANTR